MKILFICSANKVRSATAEIHFSEEYPQHEFDSAGTNHDECRKNGTTPLEEHHLEWADKIFVMEDKHRQIIRKHTGETYQKKIVTLGIKDIYKKPMDKNLIKTLENKMSKYLFHPTTVPPIRESYIISIGDILIDSESILNNPSISFETNHCRVNLPNMPRQIVQGAIRYGDIRVEIEPSEELIAELRTLFQQTMMGNTGPVKFGMIKEGLEVSSMGIIKEIFNYEDSAGFVFTPNYVSQSPI